MCADYYIAWAFYPDRDGNLKEAEEIFQNGLQLFAQPYERLLAAHLEFHSRVSIRVLYNDNLSQMKFKCHMDEKRKAVTRLTPRKQVSSPVEPEEAEEAEEADEADGTTSHSLIRDMVELLNSVGIGVTENTLVSHFLIGF